MATSKKHIHSWGNSWYNVERGVRVSEVQMCKGEDGCQKMRVIPYEETVKDSGPTIVMGDGFGPGKSR